MKITTLITLIIIVNEFLCKMKLMIVTNFIENDSYVKNDCQLCVCVYIYTHTHTYTHIYICDCFTFLK